MGYFQYKHNFNKNWEDSSFFEIDRLIAISFETKMLFRDCSSLFYRHFDLDLLE